MVKNYFTLLLRNISRNYFDFIIKVCSLAIGLSVSIFILLYVRNELSTDKFYHNFDRIYKLGIFDKTAAYSPFAQIIKGKFPPIEKVGIYYRNYGESQIIKKSGNENLYKVENILFANQELMEIFNFRIVSGDLKDALTRPFSLILTRSEAGKIFGSQNPVGQLVKYDNEYEFTITAVIEDSPQNSSLIYKGFASLNSLSVIFKDNEFLNSWNNPSFETYLLLKNNTDLQGLRRKLNTLFKEYRSYSDQPSEIIQLHSLKDNYFRNDPRERTKKGNLLLVYIFISLAIVVLVISVINYVNLTTAKSSKRLKEIAIRKLSGTSRTNILFQFISESVINCFIAFFLSLIILESFQSYFSQLVSLKLRIDYTNWIFLLIISAGVFLTGVIAGLFPALVFSSYKPSQLLQKTPIRDKIKFRTILTLLQLTLSIAVISSTMIIQNQLNYMKSQKLGFDRESIVWFGIPEEMKSKYEAFRSSLLQNPRIINVSISSSLPGLKTDGWNRKIDNEEKVFRVIRCDDKLAELLGLQLKEGRWFREDEKEGAVVFNETAIKTFNLAKPMETFVEPVGPVIGVVKDFHFRYFNYEIEPCALVYMPKSCYMVSIKVAPGHLREAIQSIEKTWHSFTSGFPFEYDLLDDSFGSLFRPDEKFLIIFRCFAFIAILISCMGIFGLVVHDSQRRTKEIGIRKVNGAQSGEIMRMLSKEFTKWVAIAFVIACPVSYFTMNKWLQNFAYKTAINWWIFVFAGIVAFLVVLVTVSWQSWKAANMNPVEALKYE